MVIQPGYPSPKQGESPTFFADRLGEWYTAQTSEAHKARYGQFLTPPAVASFMGALASASKHEVKILDPGAGTGVLSCALCETFSRLKAAPSVIELTAYETETNIIRCLSASLEYLKEYLKALGIEFGFTIRTSDFILDNAACLTPQESISFDFLTPGAKQLYNYIIGNPPYFKIPKDDPRAKACLSVIHGQPNIYALFLAVSANLLKRGGELIFITPRSYAAGPYFRLFRDRFFHIVRPLQVHSFGSRTDAFDRNVVLQENVILHGVRDDNWNNDPKGHKVIVSFSNGAYDLDSRRSRMAPMSEVIDTKGHNKYVHIVNSNEDQEIVKLINSWPWTLHKHALEISTGPVVPFRANQFIHSDNGAGKVPLLWMQNVKALRTSWPVITKKEQYIMSCPESAYLLLPNRNYVLLRRFSAKEDKRRLTAAPYIADNSSYDLIAIENHLNYIYRPKGQLTKYEAYGIAALLSYRFLDTYFRTFNGNTQVSATELRGFPLPSMEIIKAIGKEAVKREIENSEVDSLVSEILMQTEVEVDEGR